MSEDKIIFQIQNVEKHMILGDKKFHKITTGITYELPEGEQIHTNQYGLFFLLDKIIDELPELEKGDLLVCDFPLEDSI